jgi:hypothetical protein
LPLIVTLVREVLQFVSARAAGAAANMTARTSGIIAKLFMTLLLWSAGLCDLPARARRLYRPASPLASGAAPQALVEPWERLS